MTADHPAHTIVDAARRSIPALLVLCVLLLAWQSATAVFDIPSILLPSPTDIGASILSMWRTLLSDAVVTGTTALLGLLGGAAAGSVIVFIVLRSPRLSRLVLPYVIALRIAPLVVIAPLIFLWLGHGITARAVLVAAITVFPITIATLDGLRSTPERYLVLMRTVAASSIDELVRVRIPAAAPSVFAGFKIAATLSIIGTVVAEFLTLDAGLGYRVFITADRLQTPRTWAALTALSLLGLVFYVVPLVVEKRYADRFNTRHGSRHR